MGGHVTTFAADEFAKALRKKRGDRTLRLVGEQVGLSATQLMRLEKCDSEPTISTFLLLCDWLNVRPATYLEDDRLHPRDECTRQQKDEVVQ